MTIGQTRLNLLFLSISLISAAALSYEILLMRLLSIAQWHHFAYMIISLALLGYGVSGTFLTFIKAWGQEHFGMLYKINATLFGITTIGCFSIAQHVPFNGLELVWNPWQLGWLISIYLLLALPFFFAANCFGLAFIAYHKQIHRIYRWDLIGAGIGALAIISALFTFHPQTCLKLIAFCGIAAAALILFHEQNARFRSQGIFLLVGIAGLLLLWPARWYELNISQFKGLPQVLQVTGTRAIAQRSSPLGLLTVVESPRIPFRIAPGLSLSSTAEPPTQLAVFTDGDGMSVITQFDGALDPLKYLDDLTSALPYHLMDKPRVLVLGAGGGGDILQALYHQASSIDAVELNAQMVDLVSGEYAEFSGQLFRHPRVTVHIEDARGFLADNRAHYDLIQLTLLDSFTSSGAGTHALSETYLYTVQALKELYGKLSDGGMIAITRWLKLPPRDSLKLVATAIDALHQSQIAHPERRLALIRSWQTSTLLIKKGGFTAADVDAIRAFSKSRSFDVAYFPGVSHEEVNRYNILEAAYLHEGTLALLGGEPSNYLERYKFNLTPATDDQPYFFHFFKWRLLPELFALRDQGGLVLLDSGYLILAATLLQALPISVVLILLPLRVLYQSKRLPKIPWRPAGYFFLLGLAFLFIEIAFIQKFILFVSHPLFAVAAVLSGFLLFAGLGSGLSARMKCWLRSKRWTPIDLAVIGIGVIALCYLLFLPALLSAGIALPREIKILITIILIAPLAFFMGMPFPLGLARLADKIPEVIPWAWGINGCASVLSAILATLIAIHLGFQVVIVLAISLYGLATLIWR